MSFLKKSSLEEKHLVPTGYRFVVPKADATVNKLPAKCITMYRAAFTYGIRFSLYLVIVEILNKNDLACANCTHVMAQHMFFHSNL